ncbi:MAG: acyl-CoA reductase [Myxococcota bacterium]
MNLLTLSDLDAGPGRALLDATVAMGFSYPVARAGLDAELEAWALSGALEAVLTELPGDLDPRRRPTSVLVIGARTLPASMMRATLMARLLGARVYLKPASGQAALGRALALADPEVRVEDFPSDDVEALKATIDKVDAVVVLGSDETVGTVRGHVPTTKAFVGYGHKLSVAWLDRVDQSALLGLAHDLCAWDQAGCLSPQVVWTSGDPEAVALGLADAVRAIEAALPMALPDAAAAPRRMARTYGEMVGAVYETETALICALPTSTFRPSPGHRVLWVCPAAPGVLDTLGHHVSTIGISGALGVPLPEGVRRCALGQMQRPPLTWVHDGQPNLLPMLRE